jgi:hypothetical protein
MKSATKITLTILVFALAGWAQTATQTPAAPSDAQKTPVAQSETKAGCPCCQKMAEGKDAMSCCAHHKGAKSDAAMTCCSGKDGKSCMKGDKSAKADCAGCKCCNGEGQKDCCAECAKNTMAMACCGHGHCGKGHDHTDIDK